MKPALSLPESQPLPFWHVDAFADRPFAGNQAAVILLGQWPDDGLLQAIAEENRFAETAFLVPVADGADYELRWFTPTVEVALCGHATLASGHAVLLRDDARDVVRFRTRKAGLLEVRRLAEGYALSLPAITVKNPGTADLAAGLGAEPVEILTSPEGYGIFLYPDEASVRALQPDMRALMQHGDFMFICTAQGEQTDVVSRVFVPGAGVDEDSVTGSAHAALAPFWAARLGRTSFTAYQASQRGGHLTCLLDGTRVVLGGHCVTVVEGRFYLSG